MNDLKIGQFITGPQERDAIHVAVAPVSARYELRPGEHIGFMDDGTVSTEAQEPIGIVDPFIFGVIPPKIQFWMFLYPNSITSLRHDWSHPAFPVASRKISDSRLARKILEAFGDSNDMSLDEVLRALAQMESNGRVPVDITGEISDSAWDAYEVIVGHQVANRAEYFACSCP